jgi:release factor glutamine methyltransferase
MTTDYQLHKSTKPYLDLVRKHVVPYEVKVLGRVLDVFPQVMTPKYDPSSKFHVQEMPSQKGKRFLDIGSGCGIVGLFAALQGASEVVAVDINPHAVRNTRQNFHRYNLKKASALKSNLFAKISGKFDTINFCAPYHGSKAHDVLELGVSDENYRTLRTFFKHAKKHLKPNGSVLLGFSNTGDLALLFTLIEANDYTVTTVRHRELGGWVALLLELKKR